MKDLREWKLEKENEFFVLKTGQYAIGKTAAAKLQSDVGDH